MEDDTVPLNLPTIRVWEIDENSTHYEKMIAAPSDQDMWYMWVFWSLIMAIAAAVAFFIFLAIMLSAKARKDPFNVYLLSLMAPDFLMSFCCFITCWINANQGHFKSVGLCYAQSFYFIFGIGANSWLNALVARELFRMLNDARHFRPYEPPTRRKVLTHAVFVYLYAAFVAAWGLIDQPWWPHKTQLVLGTACIPMDYSTTSTIFFYAIFFPALMGIPLVYVAYVLFRIKRDNLMPPTGKRRVLTVYFLRLAVVFVVMWLPALLFLFILTPWVHHWVSWAGGAWSHLQGLVSSLLSLGKTDVAKATRDLIRCRCRVWEDGADEESGDDDLAVTRAVTRSNQSPRENGYRSIWNSVLQIFRTNRSNSSSDHNQLDPQRHNKRGKQLMTDSQVENRFQEAMEEFFNKRASPPQQAPFRSSSDQTFESGRSQLATIEEVVEVQSNDEATHDTLELTERHTPDSLDRDGGNDDDSNERRPTYAVNMLGYVRRPSGSSTSSSGNSSDLLV